jgi:hypothetical protein
MYLKLLCCKLTIPKYSSYILQILHHKYQKYTVSRNTYSGFIPHIPHIFVFHTIPSFPSMHYGDRRLVHKCTIKCTRRAIPLPSVAYTAPPNQQSMLPNSDSGQMKHLDTRPASLNQTILHLVVLRTSNYATGVIVRTEARTSALHYVLHSSMQPSEQAAISS